MKQFRITVNGNAYDVAVEELGAGAPAPAPVAKAVPAAPEASAAPAAPVAPAAPAPVAAASATPAGATRVESPMPGTILDIKAAVGQTVEIHQKLIVLEAMKMENDIVAPKAGTIAAIHVTKGQSVDTGTLLVSIG